MGWAEVASVVFVCVAANHLGLIPTIEKLFRTNLPIVGCPKCLTFWCVLLYSVASDQEALLSLAISFLSAWAAVWLDLAMGSVDVLYLRVYEKIYRSKDDAPAAGADEGNTDDALPDVSESENP